MSIFTDTVTIYHREGNGWTRLVVEGVQWSDRYEKVVEAGRLSFVRFAIITFPGQTFSKDMLDLDEDAIFLGELTEECIDERGMRVSDLLKSTLKVAWYRA